MNLERGPKNINYVCFFHFYQIETREKDLAKKNCTRIIETNRGRERERERERERKYAKASIKMSVHVGKQTVDDSSENRLQNGFTVRRK